MSTSKTKQQVRPEAKVRKINKLAVADGGKDSRYEGIIPLFATAALPDPALLPDGVLVIDTTVNALKYTAAHVWVTL